MREWINIITESQESQKDEKTLTEQDSGFKSVVAGMNYERAQHGELRTLSQKAIRASQEVIILTDDDEFVAFYRGGSLRLVNPTFASEVENAKAPLPGVMRQANQQS